MSHRGWNYGLAFWIRNAGFPLLILAGFICQHAPHSQSQAGTALRTGLAANLMAQKGEADQEDHAIPGGLEGGVDWINTSGPIHLQDLRGKIVLLDFWTYCCINCHHVLPDLEYLEKKYPNELVVIGVHTAKFEAEKVTDNIRKKVAEYRIKHPIINDANQVLWNRFDVNSWPTIVVIDAAGEYVGAAPGEGNRALLDQVIEKKIAEAKKKGILNSEPLTFFPESEKPHQGPLLYPGKILADPANNRLFITDTGHNRIIATTLDGKHLLTIGNGGNGLKDGAFEAAQFNRPQGLCLLQGKLYVADVENHAIREIDLEAKQVRTVAGTGKQVFKRSGTSKAIETPLNSPWDVIPMGANTLAVAMAGNHQIWKLDLEQGTIGPWAGTGREDIQDGDKSEAAFAQPSGLATDGKTLFVADSEGSAVRAVGLDESSKVSTIAGTHDLPQGMSLFAFGDKDAAGHTARLQHCLGVAFADGKVYVADSYNNKVKEITLAADAKWGGFDPKKCEVVTYAGTKTAGQSDDPPLFDEPGGVSVAGDLLFVADTNNHAVRVIERGTRKVRTLPLSGVEAPRPVKSKPKFARAAVVKLAKAEVAPTQEFTLNVKIELPQGFEINADAPMPALLEAPEQPQALDALKISATGQEIHPPAAEFLVNVPLAAAPKPGDVLNLRFSVSSFECKKEGAGLCRPRNYVWEIPVHFVAGGAKGIELSTHDAVAPVASEAAQEPGVK